MPAFRGRNSRPRGMSIRRPISTGSRATPRARRCWTASRTRRPRAGNRIDRPYNRIDHAKKSSVLVSAGVGLHGARRARRRIRIRVRRIRHLQIPGKRAPAVVRCASLRRQADTPLRAREPRRRDEHQRAVRRADRGRRRAEPRAAGHRSGGDRPRPAQVLRAAAAQAGDPRGDARLRSVSVQGARSGERGHPLSVLRQAGQGGALGACTPRRHPGRSHRRVQIRQADAISRSIRGRSTSSSGSCVHSTT